MRLAAEKLLADYPEFKSVDGSAEASGLISKSIDVVVAGQAFHWFDKLKCGAEFLRILKPEGSVVLLWNDRRTDSTGFLREYENFIVDFATDYKEVNHKNLDASIFRDFFSEGNYIEARFDNAQYFDFEGLKGRILSSSYMPDENHERFEPMIIELKKIFDKHNLNNLVKIEYDTRIFTGRPKGK
jgi:SAM-dependent methyltransferase